MMGWAAMTLRVYIEIVPFGVEKDKQTIGVIDISNKAEIPTAITSSTARSCVTMTFTEFRSKRPTLQNGSAFCIAERTVHCPASSVRSKRSNARIRSHCGACAESDTDHHMG